MKTATIPDLELVIKRTFNAPRELVFACWTETEHKAHWQGAPKGFTVRELVADIRPGGTFKLCMTSPKGQDHWLQGRYIQVERPSLLRFTHCWLDADGRQGTETLVTVTFTESDGRTELTLRQTGFGTINSRDGHAAGWNSTLDGLAEYLNKRAQ
ncbi:MAG: SRPBCC domain-containing protein [Flavobacteriales bacterium]|jgi:uncharacterized protein YndB with AHSA1/START domain|nr:SRPBCC domain-containing protein [Flavobacteriales bacterium]